MFVFQVLYLENLKTVRDMHEIVIAISSHCVGFRAVVYVKDPSAQCLVNFYPKSFLCLFLLGKKNQN